MPLELIGSSYIGKTACLPESWLRWSRMDGAIGCLWAGYGVENKL